MKRRVKTEKQSRSSKVGFLLASSSAPRSFQPSLMERDSIDQGVVTGLTMAISYALGAITQDGLEMIADQLSNDGESSDHEANPDKSDRVSLLLSASAIGVGLAAQYLFRQKKGEPIAVATTRTGGHILARVGLAGVVSQALETVAQKVAKGKNRRQSELVYSMIVPSGVLIAVLMDRLLYRDKIVDNDPRNTNINKLKSVGIGAGVVAVLGGLSFLERSTARTITKTVDKYAPSLNNSWLPIGHLASLGLLGGGVLLGIKKLYGDIENGAGKLEAHFTKRPTAKEVSGSKYSFVPWKSLSVQGRRHIGTRLSASQIAKTTGAKISQVKEPIRVYVGLDSAATENERVQLALKELERTNAYGRKTIVIISPTGTGYVNYVMSDSVEYMSLGDCAQVTIQYSKRPSPLSLDLRGEGHVQFRMLVNGIRKKVQDMPATKRPKLVIFGESLGAWTSQDAFLFEGTDGFAANLIDKSLWIGTPAMSKWKDYALSNKTLNTDVDQIGVFDNYGEYEKLAKPERKKLKYFMITHYNDPVARFTTRLLVQSPDWLQEDAKRPPTIPSGTLFKVPGTFVQTLVDMKNALKPIPGQFVSTGHDYRGALAPFIRSVFEFDISDQQYNTILAALKENDKSRARKSV
ncbi:alpha/beta-hydrolase family protein [Candidatus Nomurabacteria bacterium]|nr:alpha/beta-hydrolase family protein [Candidatus Saccharibacteria bacterium]MCB9839660.1 alpha/beta-hydrolase family protein [Candidatus Nomurabacteria bacterium]